jgi:hypothetical protein
VVELESLLFMKDKELEQANMYVRQLQEENENFHREIRVVREGQEGRKSYSRDEDSKMAKLKIKLEKLQGFLNESEEKYMDMR